MSEKEYSESFRVLIDRGLSHVEEIHEHLVAAFLQILESQGEDQAATRIREGFKSQEPMELSNAGLQAFSYYFQLLNLAEEHVANEMRREREAKLGSSAEPGGWGKYFEQLKKQGFSADSVRQTIAQTEVEPVFTKHPTEAKRWSVLHIHREIVALLKKREHRKTRFEAEQFKAKLGSLMERLWLTGEIFSKKPGVNDEFNNLLYYLTEILPQALITLDLKLRQAWQESWPEETPLSLEEMPSLNFGSWVGGDRDGHPLVTSDVTEATLGKLRDSGIKVIRKHLNKLARKLAFTPQQTPPPPALLDALNKGDTSKEYEEPWRAYVKQLSAEMKSNKSSPQDCIQGLQNLAGWLTEAGAERMAKSDVLPLVRLLDGFGFHLAHIDVRQNSAYYEKALSQIMEAAHIEDAANYTNWSEEAKLAFLNRELSGPRPLTHITTPLPPEAIEARMTLRVLAQQIKNHGPDGVGVLIVSMTRTLSDLLTVYILCREVGLTYQAEDGLRCAIPVVPLFETYDDLERAPGITDAFLTHPVTRNSLSTSLNNSPKLMIMLGYSDSNKDTGILASQWVLQRAQRRLVEVGKQHSVDIQFFHGRGGTVGRGAGPAHRFLEALPSDSLNAGLRLTEQGEVIGQKYNTAETATTNLEVLLAGTLGARLLSAKKEHPAMLETAMGYLSDSSQARYRALLQAPGFMQFYRQATPIDAIERSRIGSRPSRRTGQATLEDLRAIPWVFSWNQSRFYLPGWYGVGTALNQLQIEHPESYAFIRGQLQETPFLRYLFYNIESSLASSDLEWMQAYADLVTDTSLKDQFFGTIQEERNLTKEKIQELFGSPLTERRPRFWRTLQLREAPLSVLHTKQIEMLKQLRNEAEPQPETVEALLHVINAIASGLRTTG